MKHTLQGRNVLVVGMGKSGLAAMELLRRHRANVSATDEKPASPDVLPQTDDTFTSADLIVLADRIHTMSAPGPAVTALAIRGGLITAVGTRDDVRGWRGDHTEVIELNFPATEAPGAKAA